MSAMTLPANLDQLTAEQLRALVLQQAAVMTRNDRELHWRQTKIDKLTHEVAYYKRHYFGVKAERLPASEGPPLGRLGVGLPGTSTHATGIRTGRSPLRGLPILLRPSPGGPPRSHSLVQAQPSAPGAPSWARTSDLQLRRLLLYPAEL